MVSSINKKKAGLLIMLFLLSFLIRVPALDRPKITYDEHVYFGDGMKRVGNFNPDSEVWTDKLPRYIDNPPLPFYYFGSWALIGEGMGASSYSGLLYWARLGGVVLGSLLVVLSFLIARKLFDTQIAVSTGLIMSALPLAVGWSRISYPAIVIISAFTLTVYIFFKTREWRDTRRIPVLALSCGLPFAAKYTGIFVVPLMAILYVIHEEKPLSVRISGYGGRRDDWVYLLIDFVSLNIFFLLGAYIFLVAVFPYLWSSPVNNFLHIFLKESSRGHLEIFQVLYAFAHNLVNIVIRNPVPVILLAGFGIYRVTKERSLGGLSLFAWFAAPLLISLLGFSKGKYTLPVIVPISILAAYGLKSFYQIIEGRTPANFHMISIALFIFLLASTVSAYPYLADGYYSGAVGFSPGAFDLAEEKPISGPGWLGSGVGEGITYIYRNAPPGATVQIYADPQPFYIGIDRSLKYIDPTEEPRAKYVLVNSLYVLKDRKRPSFWYVITRRPNYPEKHNLNLSLNYRELEENPRYRRVWQAGTMGAPVARVYKRSG